MKRVVLLCCFVKCYTPSSSPFSERPESGGLRSRAAADGRAGRHHRTEEPDRQQLGSGEAEVGRREIYIYILLLYLSLSQILLLKMTLVCLIREREEDMLLEDMMKNKGERKCLDQKVHI